MLHMMNIIIIKVAKCLLCFYLSGEIVRKLVEILAD